MTDLPLKLRLCIFSPQKKLQSNLVITRYSIFVMIQGQIKEKRLNEILSAIQEHPADIQSLEVKSEYMSRSVTSSFIQLVFFRNHCVMRGIFYQFLFQNHTNMTIYIVEQLL